ncbi:MAG: type II secretion system minor pseudopilin GspH [Gammaproteobacteria bacterium]|nr:type II secretion system minor pseudopilin GspH [Gammaproteobacteria bacterium]
MKAISIQPRAAPCQLTREDPQSHVLSNQSFLKQQGFTLLEILVVIFIVGVMASVAMLSISGENFDDRIEKESRKLSAQVSLLQDEAIVQSREFGVRLWQNGYRFWAWDKDTGWLPLQGDDDFKAHVLIDDAEINLSLNGQPVPLDIIPVKGFPAPQTARQNTQNQTGPDFRQNLPHIVLFSSGEATGFEALFRHPDSFTQWTVNGDLIGSLKISSEVVE